MLCRATPTILTTVLYIRIGQAEAELSPYTETIVVVPSFKSAPNSMRERP